jgi:ABC-type amino acid transport system permease subunit
VHEGAGIGLNLKGAIESVDPIEIEAARGIGFSAFGAFATITLPQVLRKALPSYANGFVVMTKLTAVVGYISVQDLTMAGNIIRSRTFDGFFPLVLISLIYLTVTAVCVSLFRLVVRTIDGDGR